MTENIDADDILVTVDHPFGPIEVPFSEWIRTGPGPRPGARLSRARHRVTGQEIPLADLDDPWRSSET